MSVTVGSVLAVAGLSVLVALAVVVTVLGVRHYRARHPSPWGPYRESQAQRRWRDPDSTDRFSVVSWGD